MLLQEVFNQPEKQWTQDGNHVYAEIISQSPYRKDQYGFKQGIVLKDVGNNEMPVTVQTKYEKGLITPQMVGAKASWRLKWYSGKQGQQLVGYCLDKLPEGGQAVPQSNQAPPQNAQQAPQQAAQGTKASGDVDWDAKDLRQARMNGLNNATRLVCLMAEAGTVKSPDVALITLTAESIVYYIYNGLFKQNVVKQAAAAATPNPAMGGEDDIPF